MLALMMTTQPIVEDRKAKFSIGEVVRHRSFPFRGVIYDVDPTFANTDQWWESIPESVRPAKDQPYYHLLAENEQTTYEAYVSEQNLLVDGTGEPCRHPLVEELFESIRDGRYVVRSRTAN
jgi:heat shock protein HspQ